MATDRIKTIQRHLLAPNLSLKPTAAVGGPSGQFRYTLDNPLLTPQQREFYEINGFIVIPNVVEPELMGICAQRFIDLCEGKFDKGSMTMMKDVSLMERGATGQFLYNKVQDIAFDDVFSKYILHERLLDYVQCFTGPNIMAMHTMLINKPPDSGAMTSRHPLHQDLHYFPFRPADRIVAAWTAMEPVTADNGCLVVLPGSHRKGVLYQHEYPEWEGGVNKFYHGIRGFEDEPLLLLPMNPGDTVFFHPLIIHGSGANVTKGFRKAISCHYAAAECEYIDVKGTSQENIAVEIESLLKKRGLEADYNSLWHYRSRLARGVSVNL
ncbi:phytanoyl-CoA dioxygenase, peroxisomal-like [Cloeon dipterum]|uniref:phytanoyl-CoA dioxygenase, peroxisomal-like n=1 Tax=Cloeon dipterum TaxID=197152 RepID=UPI00321FA763